MNLSNRAPARIAALLLVATLAIQPLGAVVFAQAPAPGVGAPAAPAIPVEEPQGEPISELPPSAIDPETLPRDFTPIGMFLNADIIVQTVMVGLVLASVLTWTVFLAKGLQVSAARRSARSARAALRNARTLDEAERYVGARGAVDQLIREAGVELDLSLAMPAEGIKERVSSRLDRIEAASSRRMSAGIGVLATIGSVSPFVGLFGTVWGIMNSFIGISRAQTTNLAIVAPGIAEALLATGIGLVAAIPAVVIYNVFSRWIGNYRAELADSSAEIMRLVGRDLDRRGHAFAQAAQ